MAEDRFSGRRYRLRWKVAMLINRLPWVCYHQMASWAHFGPEPERRVWNCRPTLSCRIDAQNHGLCWCGKFTDAELNTPPCGTRSDR